MGAYGLWPVQAVLGLVGGGLLALNGLWLGATGCAFLVVGAVAKIVTIRAEGAAPGGSAPGAGEPPDRA